MPFWTKFWLIVPAVVLLALGTLGYFFGPFGADDDASEEDVP